MLGLVDNKRVRFLNCQGCDDEISEWLGIIEEMADSLEGISRTEIPTTELTVGLKCWGSDGFSGITANPLLDTFSDILVSYGGSVILVEVPEMFGAEKLLMNRCASEEIFNRTVDLINDFKNYFLSHGRAVYENPSPGYKQGGITTLEENPLVAYRNVANLPLSISVINVLAYGTVIEQKGLILLWAPGNDLVSSSALVVAGAHLVLFTTGAGPFCMSGSSVQISSNSELAQTKSNWIDLDAGGIIRGEKISELGTGLFDYVLMLASGEIKTKSEILGLREYAFFKQGVTL